MAGRKRRIVASIKGGKPNHAYRSEMFDISETPPWVFREFSELVAIYLLPVNKTLTLMTSKFFVAGYQLGYDEAMASKVRKVPTRKVGRAKR